MKQFFDTNVLLYQFDDSAPEKKRRAYERITTALTEHTFVISTQVMMEFYANATGIFKRTIAPERAQRLLLGWSENHLVVTLTPQMIVDAASLRERHGVSWWDANIIVAAQRSGAEVLVTEDLQHGQLFDGLRVENPFFPGVHEAPADYATRRKKTMTPISLEFFPPKTDEQKATLEAALPRLKALKPDYVSCTFGAGGSTLSYTPETVRHLHEEHGLDAAPHLSCVGGTREDIRKLLDEYAALGVRRIVALRGDLPSGMASYGDFRYASELVEFIRREHGKAWHIEVACYPEVHPQSDDAHADMKHFKAKVDAGANGAITQYFYNADAYFRFVEAARKAGVTIPIVPGIMPISNFSQLSRFSDMCGAEIPRWLSKRLTAYGDDAESIREFAADVVAELCTRLVAGGAPGLHFYTLNRAKPTLTVVDRL